MSSRNNASVPRLLAEIVAVTLAPQYVHIVLFDMYFLAVCVLV